MSTGVERVIDTIYRPLGYECHLLPHPSENQIVTEALDHHRSRLLGELAICEPDTVVTLGNAAARVFAELTGRAQRKLSTVGYGTAVQVQLDGRDVRWLTLAHPAAPKPYQAAHDAWVAELAR